MKKNGKYSQSIFLHETGSNNLLLHLSIPDPYILNTMKVPPFYIQLVKSWYACKDDKHYDVTSSRQLREQILWGNANVRFKGKMLWYKNWIASNIVYVNDVFDEHGVFNEEALFRKIKDKANIMSEMHMLKNAIPGVWKLSLLSDPCKLHVKPCRMPILHIDGKMITIDTLQSSKTIYVKLVYPNKKIQCTQVYWREIFQEKNIVWTNVYIGNLKNVLEQKIVAFNFKLLHNIVATPHKLYRWKIFDNSLCHLCFSEGTLEHMMLRCCYFDMYYEKVKYVLKQLGYANTSVNMYTLICGHKPNVKEYKNLNLILNIIFYNVYKCWVKINIDRNYIDPLRSLCYELNVRCNTKTYCNDTFITFKDCITQLIV